MNCPHSPGEDLGVRTQPAVGRDGDVEAASGERRADALGIVRVGVDMLDLGRNLGWLVATAVQNRRTEAAIDEALDDEGPSRPRSPDHERRLAAPITPRARLFRPHGPHVGCHRIRCM